METGDHGDLGEDAIQERKQEQGHVLIQLLSMEEGHVQDQQVNQLFVL